MQRATLHSHGERRALQAERAVELAAVATAIREKIDLQLAELPPVLPAALRPRRRYMHPDQLTLPL